MHNIYIFGAWHQGFVSAGVLAENEYIVTCVVDTLEEKVKFDSVELPVFEPGLQELVTLGKESGRILFAVKSDVVLKSNSVVILAHDTKVNEQDESDLSDFNSDLDFVINAMGAGTQILISAQVPAGTYARSILQFSNVIPNLSEQISFLPENLRLGKALERFRKPPLPVVGCSDANKKFWRDFFEFTGVEFHFCTQVEAELLKHSLNSYLAMNIAFGNELHRLGNAVGANGKRIIELLELEPRVGKLSPKRPGLPFFGGTLARDLVSLQKITRDKALKTPVIGSILDSNNGQKDYVLKMILETEMLKVAKDLSICVLGLTYTAETSTLRRSPGLWLIRELLSKGFKVTAFDPRVTEKQSEFQLFTTVEQVCSHKVDCFILVSPWLSLKDEISEFVTSEHFVDIEGHLSQSGVALPPNYRQIF
jgi:UDPglucose 6-dehydrogenase